MTDSLGQIQVHRKRGDEPIHDDGQPVGPTVGDYWQWAHSDVLSNTERGILAEYIVATALGVENENRSRWDAYDLEVEGICVEVKSSAYIQTWKQDHFSALIFGIAPTYYWNPATNAYEGDKRRQADVYVFCVLANKDQKSIDPLDVSQWDLYVLGTEVLNRRVGAQKRIGLEAIRSLEARAARFEGVRDAVFDAAG